jgi:hypothetical protein
MGTWFFNDFKLSSFFEKVKIRNMEIDNLQYHLLDCSASNVVRTGRSVNGNRPKLTPCRSETSWPIKTKLNTIHYVRGTPHRPKLIISRLKGPRHQRVNIWALCWFFLFCSFLVNRVQQKRLGRCWRSIRQTTRSHTRKCLLPPNASKNFQGFTFPKNPQIWARNRDFPLKQNHELLFNRSCDFRSN